MYEHHFQIYDDDELDDYVKKLNALYTWPDQGWRKTQARKDHVDEFGDRVVDGESYFKREYGPAWDDVLKLSRTSIEKLLFCVFSGNFGLQGMCDRLIDDQQRQLAEAHAKFAPLRNFDFNSLDTSRQ